MLTKPLAKTVRWTKQALTLDLQARRSIAIRAAMTVMSNERLIPYEHIK